MDQQQAIQLCEMAITAREMSYSPYSRFAVGAALLCEDENVFLGCNVENAAFGLSICAERVAVCKAISEGFSKFKAIAVAASPLATPCGSCRQFLSEFSSELTVYCCNGENLEEIEQWQLAELLPASFSFPPHLR